MREITLKVPEMVCVHCKKRISDAAENAGATVKELDLTSKKLVLESDMSDAEAVALLDDAGYDAEVI